MLEPGDPIPDVTITGGAGEAVPLRRFVGRPLVLYFYPRDDTAGCTREAVDFSALRDAFDAAGTAILGVSRDTPAKHAKFVAKHELRVALATDADAIAMQAFGVWGERTLYGRRYMGVERSTFLFDADGRLVQSWRKVKVAGHAEDVLAAAKALAADR